MCVCEYVFDVCVDQPSDRERSTEREREKERKGEFHIQRKGPSHPVPKVHMHIYRCGPWPGAVVKG